MRFYDVALLTVATVLALTDAMSTSDSISTTPFGTSDGNIASTVRFLRKSEPVEEERGGFKDILDKATRKAKKLMQYNTWIYSDKSPEWVTEHYPEFAKGYKTFWENRMVRGGKYN
ncbi:Putative RxLR effector [Phytophthora palmivora]|uniref:RxLR effector protein n=1 Tax=Phytophthora palmivora TaxID=4796 RepID=A0A2P4Y7A4_9STRA|nr:Putative RxLR effector [Phytophthora palmivora]